MNKEFREDTWMEITLNRDDYTDEVSISIQDFLDGDIRCITEKGDPYDEYNPQRELSFEDFIRLLLQEWRKKIDG